MTEKGHKFIFNLKWPICIAALSVLAQNNLQFLIIMSIAVIFFLFNILEYFLTKTYKPIGQLHPNSTEKEKQEAIEGSVEDKFINEVLGYASSLGLNPTLDFSNGAMSLIDYNIEANTQIPICNLIFPEMNAKYGSDKYKSAVEMMKEQIDNYSIEKEKTVNKVLEEEVKKNDKN